MYRSVDILIPTYNRKQFEKQISKNINNQTYPFINKVIIADDGDPEQRLELNVKYPVEYHIVDRMTIGAKRNFLQTKSTAQYIANIDTDDVYNPDYISNCIFNLTTKGAYITGSADMIMKYQDNYYIHRCISLELLNEATIVCVNNKRQYNETNSSEGKGYLKGLSAYITETDIKDIMYCIVHDKNTVDKKPFLKELCGKPF